MKWLHRYIVFILRRRKRGVRGRPGWSRRLYDYTAWIRSAAIRGIRNVKWRVMWDWTRKKHMLVFSEELGLF